MLDQEVYTEELNENSIRPQALHEFAGQNQAMDNLGVYIRGACRRAEPLDHTLFYGPPGLGKTTLSRIMAHELGVGLRSISAPSIAKPGDLASVLLNIQPRDVLFIDEIHRLPNVVEEMLYSAMEDYKVTILIGEGQAEPIEIDIAPFTLIAATTRKGMLTQPLQDRFGIQVRLDYYEVEQLKEILLRAADRLLEPLTVDSAQEIAQRSRGTPRIALTLLKRLRDFREDKNTEYTATFVRDCLDQIGVDDRGLDELDIRYLDVLETQFGSGPVGLGTMATALSESRDTLETSVEPYLVRQGLVAKTSRGRILL